MITLVFFVVPIALIFGLGGCRLMDHRTDRIAMQNLIQHQHAAQHRYDPAMVAGLPEPAQRYFNFVIRPNTPLSTVARIDMAGRFGMGDRHKPNYLAMQAEQVLAPSKGFVWKMRARVGALGLSGSDSERWTRFWVAGLIPVARLGGSEDHRRSAFGRYIAETVFWAPAALLPGMLAPDFTVHWCGLDENTVRVTVAGKGLEQAVDLTIAQDGQPLQVRFDRWSNANADKQFRLQPFGGYLSAFREFSGYRLPTHVEAGNHFGTEAYFPFFIADVSAVDFPVAEGA